MNIFKILASGDGKINEPSITEFLAFLLNPYSDHGLGSHFLEAFLEPLVLSDSDFNLLKHNDKIINLSKLAELYEVEIETEYSVYVNSENSKPNEKRRRDVDIRISLVKKQKIKDQQTTQFTFLIENKIVNKAIKKGQLEDWVKGIHNLEKDVDDLKEGKTGIFFITPDKNKVATDYFQKFESGNCRKYHLTWKDEEGNSIFKIISRLLEKENIGQIEPIHDYTKYTLKAFLNFIYSDFKTYHEEKLPLKRGRPGIEEDFFVKKNKSKRNFDVFWQLHEIVKKNLIFDSIDFAKSVPRIAYFGKNKNKMTHIEIKGNKVELFLNANKEIYSDLTLLLKSNQDFQKSQFSSHPDDRKDGFVCKYIFQVESNAKMVQELLESILLNYQNILKSN